MLLNLVTSASSATSGAFELATLRSNFSFRVAVWYTRSQTEIAVSLASFAGT